MEHVNEFEKEFRSGDSGAKYLFVGPHIDLGVMVLKPEENMAGHYHNEVEETFYFPEGGPVITVNGEDIVTKNGDVFRMEPHDTHAIRNISDKTVKIIYIKAPSIPTDKISL